MKKKMALIMIGAFALTAAVIFAFALNKERISVKLAGGEPEDKIIVISTLFPQYDFARQVAGDRAEVTLLLPPGVESHSYEPTPADVVRIGQSRVFLYTGDEMEPWVKRLAAGFERGRHPLLVDVSHGIELSSAGAPHVHSDGHDHGHEGDVFHSVNDPHIWTDPNNAIIMTRNVLAALVAVDPKNGDYYRENAKKYMAQLLLLDKGFKDALISVKRREIVIGGRNAMHYFLKRYRLTAHAAFDSCTAEQQPSVRAIVDLKDEIEKNGIPVVYYEELQTPRIALALVEGTDAKPLLLHSVHNLSKEDFDAGKTYISLMRQNLENLKEGLN